MQNQNIGSPSIPIVEICGKNKHHQISENSNNMNFKNCPYIYPPIKLNMDVSSILSYSTYFITIIVTSDGIAKVIGSNDEEQISTSLPKCIFEKFTSINLTISNEDPFFIISAICGRNYILYLTENKEKNTRSLLYWNSNLKSNFPIMINNDISNPLALFGDPYICLAIDDDGSIICIPEKFPDSEKILIPKISLPNNDKAINVVFCHFFIFVLGLSGKVYRSEFNNISFVVVEEIKKEQIILISGFFDRCFAVNKKGKVFIYGKLNESILHFNDEDFKFTKIRSLSKYNVAKVYSEKYHTIFQTIEGKLLAYGSNKYGELLLNTGPSDEIVQHPELTMVDNASFCIVGPHSTIVFKNYIPIMSPNQNVDVRKFVSTIAKNRFNINYTATQYVNAKRNSNSNQDKALQQKSNQNDTPQNINKTEDIIFQMWNIYNNRRNDDYLCVESGVLNCRKYLDSHHLTFFEPVRPNKKLFELFKYNKQNYHWEYLEDSFNRLIKETNHSKNVPIPLVLLLDSFYDDIKEISSMFTDHFNKYIDFGDDISIYAFIDENTSKKSIFLFLYIPEEKESFDCCESLIYQIYIFLFLICDLTINVLDEFEIGKNQISLIQKVIKVSDMYLKKFIGSSNIDKNFSLPMKVSKNDEKLFLDKSQIFIINKTSNKDLKKLIQQIISKKYYYDEGDHFKSFMSIFNSIKFDYKYLPIDINAAFNYVISYFPQISELYISHFDNWGYDLLSDSISDAYQKLQKSKFKNKTNEEIIKYLRFESQNFYPKIDIDFIKILEMKFFDLTRNFITIDENYIKTKLDKFSALQIDNIKKEISTLDYLPKEEIDTIIDTHRYSIMQQFFEIVKEKYGENMLEIIFSKKLDIIDSKLSEDFNALSKIFDEYNEKNKTKNTIEFQSFDEVGKKRANYVVKETQISRQIKIIINSDKDLETEIPQDF